MKFFLKLFTIILLITVTTNTNASTPGKFMITKFTQLAESNLLALMPVDDIALRETYARIATTQILPLGIVSTLGPLQTRAAKASGYFDVLGKIAGEEEIQLAQVRPFELYEDLAIGDALEINYSTLDDVELQLILAFKKCLALAVNPDHVPGAQGAIGKYYRISPENLYWGILQMFTDAQLWISTKVIKERQLNHLQAFDQIAFMINTLRRLTSTRLVGKKLDINMAELGNIPPGKFSDYAFVDVIADANLIARLNNEIILGNKPGNSLPSGSNTRLYKRSLSIANTFRQILWYNVKVGYFFVEKGDMEVYENAAYNAIIKLADLYREWGLLSKTEYKKITDGGHVDWLKAVETDNADFLYALSVGDRSYFEQLPAYQRALRKKAENSTGSEFIPAHIPIQLLPRVF